jgi:hypothetical protein
VTVRTNSDGVYTFTDLPAGTYRLRRDMPNGYELSLPWSAWGRRN